MQKPIITLDQQHYLADNKATRIRNFEANNVGYREGE